MKILKSKLKLIVKEELEATLDPLKESPSGRISLPSSGMDTHSPRAPEEVEASRSHAQDMEELFRLIQNTHRVAKADPSTPEHIVKSLSVIAGKLAGSMK